LSIKIIQILNHSASWKTNDLDEDIFDGWHVRTAKSIQQIQIKNCKIECWLPEKTYSQQRQIEKDGIIYRMFPSSAINYGREISWSLINTIKSESKNPILIHVHGIFNYVTYLITALFPYLPIVVQHHGDCPPLNLLQRRPLLYSILPLLIFEHFILDKGIHNIDYIYCLTKTAKQSLKYLGIKDNVKIQGMGVNFDMFNIGDKNEVRRVLNLPINSKILLYVGKLDRYKGCNKLITAYETLKNNFDIKLLIVGAKESDEFYQDATRVGAIIYPRQPHTKLIQFYQSSDIFILPGSEQYNQWGGIGINTIESLACNTPVVSGTLSHFPQSIDNIGVIASSSTDIISAVNYILKNNNKFSACREIARTYYDWQIIAENTYNIYEKLFKKYYNIKLHKDNG
jgi:glycosyltransferase involved in cell wall biosynthesis